MERPLALVIDQDTSAREAVRGVFERYHVDAHGAATAAEMTDALRNRAVRYVVVDDEAPGVDLDSMLDHAGRLHPPPVLIAVASPTSDAALRLIDAGAFDVVPRPVDPERMEAAIRCAIRHREVLAELQRAREDVQEREGYHGMVGRSPALERLREDLTRLAATDRPVWISGEPGTGKDLAARTLHRLSGRPGASVATVACSGITPRTWSERLGVDDHGAPRTDGLLAGLRGGTLVLEAVPTLDADLQSRLLTVLGALGREGLDVRVVATSSLAPDTLVDQGRLLEPLLPHLAAETLALSPLRERVEDVPLLAAHFIKTICAINLLPAIRLSPEALDTLVQQRWPDNVQGLRNALEHAVILSPDGAIGLGDLPEWVRGSGAPAPAGSATGDDQRAFRDAKRDVVEVFERSYLSRLMERHAGNVTAASQQAGMLRSALQRLLRKYGLKSSEFRRERKSVEGSGKARETTRPQR